MIKVFVLIPKRPDISDEYFHAHWRHPHAELALKITTLRGYVQAHRIPYPELGLPSGPYEGVAEIWFDDLETANSLSQDPNYTENLALDEPNFVDVPNLRSVATTEERVFKGPPIEKETSAFKVLQMVRRAANVSLEEFRSRWSQTDDAISARQLGAFRYIRPLTIPESYIEGEPTFDAFRELWWTDAEAFEEGREDSPEAWQDFIAPPFVDVSASTALAIEEYRVLWP